MTYEKELLELKQRGVRVQMLRTFQQLTKVRDEFTIGHNGFRTPFLIVIGQQGTSKSHHFENTENAKYINTAASPVGLYAAVYWCKAPPESTEGDKPVILDDVDGLLLEKGAQPLFKALGTDRTVKHVSWEKQNTQLIADGIPRNYSTTSRLCILCNTLPKAKRDLQAVLDRAKVVIFSPTPSEIHRYVGEWWPKKHWDIYDYIGANLRRIIEPSIRWYKDALREKLLGNNWREWLLEAWYDENPLVSVAGEIRNDGTFKTFNAQAAEFQRRTGLKRASYNLYLQKYRDSQGDESENVND